MLAPVRCLVICTALAVSGCGRFGFELLDLAAGAVDGAVGDAEVGLPDGQSLPESDAGRGEPDADASTPSTIEPPDSSLVDAAEPNPLDDAGTLADARVADVDAAHDASTDAAADAAAAPACAVGTASCDANPLICETTLGTTSNCARCGDVCPANGGTPQCSAGVCGSICNLGGTWGIKMTLQLSWPAGVLAAGSGSASVWLRFQGTESGMALPYTMALCGMTLPDFALQPAIASERYRIILPDTLFDQQPSFIPGSIASVAASGNTFTLSNLALTVGASLPSPLTDPWPTVAALTSVDMDMDGKPGVTASYSNASGYSYPRTDAAGAQRSDLAYVAARLILNGTGSFPTCETLTMTPKVVSFETHLPGCRIAPGGPDCSTTQRDTLDSQRPIYAPGTATMTLSNVPNTATCAEIRTTIP